jgi:hypothetical protein
MYNIDIAKIVIFTPALLIITFIGILHVLDKLYNLFHKDIHQE